MNTAAVQSYYSAVSKSDWQTSWRSLTPHHDGTTESREAVFNTGGCSSLQLASSLSPSCDVPLAVQTCRAWGCPRGARAFLLQDEQPCQPPRPAAPAQFQSSGQMGRPLCGLNRL